METSDGILMEAILKKAISAREERVRQETRIEEQTGSGGSNTDDEEGAEKLLGCEVLLEAGLTTTNLSASRWVQTERRSYACLSSRRRGRGQKTDVIITRDRDRVTVRRPVRFATPVNAPSPPPRPESGVKCLGLASRRVTFHVPATCARAITYIHIQRSRRDCNSLTQLDSRTFFLSEHSPDSYSYT
ncbi:hypothetical protein J6590_020059 [Homalodisca vitripennis]|nr:hypothetical protein J6590_020059 [Homalodisca vitripennis]